MLHVAALSPTNILCSTSNLYCFSKTCSSTEHPALLYVQYDAWTHASNLVPSQRVISSWLVVAQNKSERYHNKQPYISRKIFVIVPYCHGRGVFFQDSCASIKTKPATCTKFGHSDVDLRQIACTSRFRPPTPLLKLESIAHGWHDIEPFNILSPGEKCIKLQKRTEITQSNQEHNDCTQVNTSKGCPPHPMTQPFANSTQEPS